MSPEFSDNAPQAPEPSATPQVDLVTAFQNAQPYNPQAEPQAPATPVEAAPAPVEATNPAPAVEAAAVAPEVATSATPDYTAYLKENFGVDAPEALKEKLTLAEQAEALKANQRTAQDVAFEKLLADPYAANAFLKLQTTDYKALPDRELHAAAYAHAHPELKPDVAAIRARREYDAEYAAAEFDDPEDVAVQEAKVLRAAAREGELQTMEQAKQAAKDAVLRSATPAAEGPSDAEVKAQAEEAERTTHWTQGVEQIVGLDALELEYTVEGQAVKLAFDNKNPAFKEAMLSPLEFIAKQVQPTGDWKQANFDRMAEIVALITQPDVLARNAYNAGKASLGAVIPLDRAVNPAPSAPQPVGQDGTHDSRVAAALRSEMSRITQATYN